jgi:hypothetical protein
MLFHHIRQNYKHHNDTLQNSSMSFSKTTLSRMKLNRVA